MQVDPTEIPGVLLITPRVFSDARGWFMETYHQQRYAQYNIEAFEQDNHSFSRRGVLRGLHYQVQHPQGKLVWVTHGEIFDVAVDLRRNSPHFGKWFGCRLSVENHLQLYLPPGFAHGFYALQDAVVQYKISAAYNPGDERILAWNDPQLNIAWPLEGEPILSEKDQHGCSLAEADVYLW